uniref:NTR domain-containing protein n=1 Tax=Sinocyclocheilus anshuiensis TaxID=1608454 RepID=A0A671K3R8_9TELE
MSAAVTLALLFFLSVALNEQVTEGCTCLPKHPQQQFCASDIVIRAKVIGKVPSTLPQLTAYKIQTIQVRKCRLLDTSFPNTIFFNKKCVCVCVYIYIYIYILCFSRAPGTSSISVVLDFCDRVEPWNQLSRVQKVYLSRYQRGCICEISPCTGASCLIKMFQKKCLMRVNNSFILDDEELLKMMP